ncbi:MAG: 4Fe-4S dicluster domain-containing protein [Spirochaetota bacterium]|nr:4Fe-4S dicluster domain-containing protein [Spirochaetota bacterium]
MFYTISLYVSLVIFGLGLLYKLSIWFTRKIGKDAEDITASKRIATAFAGIFTTLFSSKFFTLLKVFLLDVILQRKLLKQDFLKWLMHIFIYFGFLLLLFMHAMEKIITSNLFDDYYSTLNPFMFLRDLFGLLVILGILIAVYRRFILKVPRLSTNGMDVYAIIIIIIIILSGVLLEGVKITSYSRYQEMVEEYSSTDAKDDLQSLELYWIREFLIVPPIEPKEFDEATLRFGQKMHDENCSECHSNPKWAFTGYITAGIIKPVAHELDKSNIRTFLLYIHFIAVFMALAYLPFSKMFHIITTPISLLVNSVIKEDGESNPANIATKQVMELDACTHCSTCSLRCSALAAYLMTGNSNILPSEKITHIKALINGRKMTEDEMVSLQEGVYICTNCDRCTVVCPSGIDLKNLWFQVKEQLIHNGHPTSLVLSPFSFSRGLMRDRIDLEYYSKPIVASKADLTTKLEEIKNEKPVISLSKLDRDFLTELDLSIVAGTYTKCFSCSTCTSSCPVVSNYEEPSDVLGLLPHQIIHSAALGLKEIAMGSKMLWDCLTCYKCQENCPQGVRVTEVFYKLKNMSKRGANSPNVGVDKAKLA